MAAAEENPGLRRVRCHRRATRSRTALRHGVRAAAKLARQSLVSGEYIANHSGGSPPSIEHGGATNRRGLRLVTDAVALLALATLVLACLRDVDLAIIIAPFALALIGLPIAWRAESRVHRRKTAEPAGDKADVD
jgi:hypothetical protein